MQMKDLTFNSEKIIKKHNSTRTRKKEKLFRFWEGGKFHVYFYYEFIIYNYFVK